MSSLANADATSDGVQEFVAVETRQNSTNGSRVHNGTTHHNGHSTQHHNPYAPRASDFLNNVSNFKIIESTLRGFNFYQFEAFHLYDVVQRASSLPMPFLTPIPR